MPESTAGLFVNIWLEKQVKLAWKHARINTVPLSNRDIYSTEVMPANINTCGTTPNAFTSDFARTKPAFPQIQSVNSWLTGADIVFRGYIGCSVLLCLYTAHKREGTGASSEPLYMPSASSLPIQRGDEAQGGNEPCFLASQCPLKISQQGAKYMTSH